MLGADGKLIVRVNALEAVCFGLLPSVTVTVKLDVPFGPSGDPVIAPVLLFKLRPGGKVPALIAYVSVPKPVA
jgi:hypothetical protein